MRLAARMDRPGPLNRGRIPISAFAALLCLGGLFPVDADAQTRRFSAQTKYAAPMNGKLEFFDSPAVACETSLVASGFLQANNSTQTITGTCTITIGVDPNGNPILQEQPWSGVQTRVTTLTGAALVAGPQWACTSTEVVSSSFTACGTTTSNSNTYYGSAVGLVQEVRVCPPGWPFWDALTCFLSSAQEPKRPSDDCRYGNPIAVGSGCKQETVELYSLKTSTRQVSVSLHYNSQPLHGGGRLMGDRAWMLDPFDRRLVLDDLASLGRIYAVRREGHAEGFEQQVGGTFKSFDNLIMLTRISPTEWRRTDFSERTIETFNAVGALVSVRYFEGGGFDLQYGADPNRPTAIVSTLGHRVDLQYTAQLSALLLPDGKSVGFGYTALTSPIGNATLLTSVTFQNGTSRQFSYQAAQFPSYGQGSPTSYAASDVLPYQSTIAGSGSVGSMSVPQLVAFGRPLHLLSTVTDETNTVLSEFTYDNQGRATQTQRAGGVDRHQVSYPSALRSNVVSPLGSSVSYVYLTNNEQQRLSRIERRDDPSNPNSPVFEQSFNYDSGGNVIERADSANKNRRCSAFDVANGLETIRVEGIAWGGCPGDVAAYAPTAGTAERKIQWQYNTTRRLPTAMAEPLKITTFVYHGLPDPTAGNAIASCMTAGAPNLPNGWAPAPLCKRVEQATTDATGASGFGATASGTARTWTFAYNADGQLLSANGPRTDATDVTNYAYYTSDDAASPPKYRRGDLQTMTSAAGHVTQYTDYDRNRRPTRIVDPNGVVTTIVYNDRGWLQSATTSDGSSSRPVTISYLPHGKVQRITQPDGSYLQFGYDAAQRLTSVTDNLGNSVTYTLDNVGNRTAEQFRDSSNTLRQRVTRVFDTLSRLQSVTGALQ